LAYANYNLGIFRDKSREKRKLPQSSRGEMGRGRDGEMGRWSDGEMERWGDGERGDSWMITVLINDETGKVPSLERGFRGV